MRISTRRDLVAAELAAILGGILVYEEPIGSEAIGITARLLAFCLASRAQRSFPRLCA